MRKVELHNPVHFASFSCPHFPVADERALDYSIEHVAELGTKPGRRVVICKGDLYEADSASRWPSEYSWTLEDEYAAADAFLYRLRMAAGDDVEFVFLPGNHDDNLLAINRLDPKIRSLCDWRRPQHSRGGIQINKELLTYWKIPTRYEYHPIRGCYRIGQACFSHGYRADQSADEFQAIDFCWEFGIYIGGHTHRPTPDGDPIQAQKTKQCKLRVWYVNSGCLRDMDDVPYMLRKNRSNWGQAVTTGEVEPLKSPRRERRWNVRNNVYRMFGDE